MLKVIVCLRFGSLFNLFLQLKWILFSSLSTHCTGCNENCGALKLKSKSIKSAGLLLFVKSANGLLDFQRRSAGSFSAPHGTGIYYDFMENAVSSSYLWTSPTHSQLRNISGENSDCIISWCILKVFAKDNLICDVMSCFSLTFYNVNKAQIIESIT